MRNIYRVSFFVCRLAALGILVAAHSMCAQVDIYDSYPKICNDGEKPFWLATAYNTVRGWIADDRWEVDGWFQVDPHECKEPGGFKFEDRDIGKHPIVLWAVAFVDREGNWGWVRVHADADKDYGMWRAKDVPLCVARDKFHYTTREGEQDAPSDDQCSKPGFFKIMSTFQSWPVLQETSYGSGVYGSRKPELHTEIPSDLKVFPPLDANASTNSAESQPAVKNERESGNSGSAALRRYYNNQGFFMDIVKDALVGPGAPRLRRRACPVSRSCDDIEVCAPKSFVDGNSWSSAKNADFLKTELRNYVSTHVLGNFPAVQRWDGPVGSVSIQVDETGAHDVLSEEISDCGKVEHVFSTFLHKIQWASDGQPSQPGQEQKELPPPGPGASIDLSSLMSGALGISQGYTQQQVAGLYRPVSLRTAPHYPEYTTGRYDGGLEIEYKSNWTMDLTILSRSLSAKEPLADLVGRTESEARSMLQESPTRVLGRESGVEFQLCWYFPNYPGRQEETFCPVRRTLAVDFKRDAGDVPRVSAVHVNWGDW